MNYKKLYKKLIENSKAKNVSLKNFEMHHIKPRCCGGSDDASNLVKLTFREHYLAHRLLVKIHPKNKKLATALWMMTITTIASLGNAQVNNIDNRQKKRIFSILENKKTSITTHEYDFSKSEYIKHMIGHEVSERTRNLISKNTKNSMLSEVIITKCSSGSKGTKHYYNKKTLKQHKWFPGDPDIDLTIYSYGRPPMSKSQKNKLSNIKKLNKTKYHNDELQLTIDVYHDCVCKIPEGWYPKKKEYKNNSVFKTIIRSIKFELLKYNVFFDQILTYTPKSITQKKKILNPAFFEVLNDTLLNWKTNKDIVEQSVDMIVKNLEYIKTVANSYLTQEFKK